MISITVHHHHNASLLGAAAPEMAKAPAVAPRTTTIANKSSNVEVQYLARTHFRRQHNQQQQQQQPSNELQNSAENHGGHIEKQQQQQQVDLNNNHISSSSSQLSFNDKTYEKVLDESAAEVATTSNVYRKQPMKLHSRSISLVINPEFSSDLDSNCPRGPLIRRRSLPRLKRRTHLRQMITTTHEPSPSTTLTSSDKDQQQQQVVSTAAGSQKPQASTDASSNEQEEVRLRCSMSLPEFSTEPTTMTTMQTTITTTTTTSTANTNDNSEAKFRQAGILLRELSDEFARCRRRTI